MPAPAPLLVDGPDRVAAGVYTFAVFALSVVAASFGQPAFFGPVAWGWAVGGYAVLGGILTYGFPVRRRAWGAAVVVGAFWLGLGAWVGYGWAEGMGGGRYWLAWLGGWWLTTAAAAVWATPSDIGLPMRPYEQDIAAAAPPPAVTPEAEWERRIAAVGKAAGAVVTGITHWDSRAGYHLDVDLPDGVTWEDLKQQERRLSGALRLPAGGAEVWAGAHTGAARITVTTADLLAEDRVYADTTPLTVNGLIPVGWYASGLPALIPVREACTLCVSQRGGGKTNWMHTLTHGFVRCPDALIWQIELSGAGIHIPWAAPYLDGRVSVPAVEWPAADVEEALWLTRVALAAIRVRKIAYAPLMLSRNTSLLPLSPDVPMIRIDVDETAIAAGVRGHPELIANLVEIIQEGRAVGVGADISALSAVSAVLPTEAQKQIGTRALFRVTDENEIGRALGWHTKLRVSDIKHKGGGRIRVDFDGSVGPIEAFRTERADQPSVIAATAVACEHLRPWYPAVNGGLDGPTLDAIGRLDPRLRDAYISRWDRVVPRLTGGVSQAVSRPPGRGSGGGSRSTVEDIDGIVQTAQRAVAQAGRLTRLDWDAEWRRLSADLQADPAPPAPAPGSEETAEAAAGRWQARAGELLDAAGPAGVSGLGLRDQLVAEGHDVPKSTLYDWLGRTAHRASPTRWARRDDGRPQ